MCWLAASRAAAVSPCRMQPVLLCQEGTAGHPFQPPRRQPPLTPGAPRSCCTAAGSTHSCAQSGCKQRWKHTHTHTANQKQAPLTPGAPQSCPPSRPAAAGTAPGSAAWRAPLQKDEVEGRIRAGRWLGFYPNQLDGQAEGEARKGGGQAGTYSTRQQPVERPAAHAQKQLRLLAPCARSYQPHAHSQTTAMQHITRRMRTRSVRRLTQRRRLHSVQPLPRVLQSVVVALAQHVRVCQVPQLEHLQYECEDEANMCLLWQ